jgi:polyhydroxybutyrate depolymerase
MKTRVGIAVVLVALAVLVGGALLSRGSSSPAGTDPSVAVTQAIVYVPPELPAGKVPLVIALHGSGGTPLGMESSTQFDRLARRHGFIVAYLASGSPGDNWILPSETASISSMIDRLEASEPIDRTRVYVTGLSAGGYEGYRSGCLLSKKVAAIAPVGVSMNQALYQTCKVSRPVSTLIVIGSADAGHYGGYSGLPSAPAAAAKWRALDGCQPAPPRASRRRRGRRIGEFGQGVRMGAAVGLNVVVGGGHIWPGPQLGSSTTDGRYGASAAIWAFFAAHRAGSLRNPDARLSSVRVKLGHRTREVELTLSLGERLTIRAALLRNRRSVGVVSRSLTPGDAVHVKLRVPHNARAGPYSLSILLTDAYGRTLKLARTIDLVHAPV